MKIKTAIALGSNLGDRAENIAAAIKQLSRSALIAVKASENWQTPPVDCVAGAPEFLNAAITGETDLSPERLLEYCLRVEEEMGRPRDRGYHDNRIIDLDVLLYGDKQMTTDELTLPHPEMHKRDFVLQPLAQIAPDWVIPGLDQTIETCLKELK